MAKRTKKFPTSVTIRQIEAAGPCRSEYVAFLRDFKSNAVPDGEAQSEYELFGDSMKGWPKFKNPVYGPDDPILLSDILKKKPGRASNMTAIRRISWIFGHVAEFNDINDKVYARESEIQDGAYEIAVKEVLGL